MARWCIYGSCESEAAEGSAMCADHQALSKTWWKEAEEALRPRPETLEERLARAERLVVSYEMALLRAAHERKVERAGRASERRWSESQRRTFARSAQKTIHNLKARVRFLQKKEEALAAIYAEQKTYSDEVTIASALLWRLLARSSEESTAVILKRAESAVLAAAEMASVLVTLTCGKMNCAECSTCRALARYRKAISEQ